MTLVSFSRLYPRLNIIDHHVIIHVYVVQAYIDLLWQCHLILHREWCDSVRQL